MAPLPETGMARFYDIAQAPAINSLGFVDGSKGVMISGYRRNLFELAHYLRPNTTRRSREKTPWPPPSGWAPEREEGCKVNSEPVFNLTAGRHIVDGCLKLCYLEFMQNLTPPQP